MNFLNLFPSNYISAADLEGQDRNVRINKIVKSEEVGQKKDKKPVLYFDGITKGMVLNKTNGKRIAKLYGNETDAWIGKAITLYPSECDFGDETVPCVRVRDSIPQDVPAVGLTAAPAADPLAVLAGLSKEQIAAILAAKS